MLSKRKRKIRKEFEKEYGKKKGLEVFNEWVKNRNSKDLNNKKHLI